MLSSRMLSSRGMSRREALACGLGAAGMLAGGRTPFTHAAEPPAPSDDRSDSAPSLPVAIQRCPSYEPRTVRQRLDAALDLIGGIGDLVRGKTVTIKPNLTGPPSGKLGGLPSYRTYQVHPNMLAAVCAAVHDAGAKRIVVVESLYSRQSPEEVLAAAGWDIRMIKSAGGNKVSFEDTRNRGSWPAYSRLKVPWGGFMFPAFDVNQRYEKTDVFISLGKMKDHANAGVTLSVKNLFGVTPTALYGDEAPNENTTSARGAILHAGKKKVPDGVPGEVDHGIPARWLSRVPRITADVVGARPIDLAIIDGIETNRGGEGFWIQGSEPIKPELLLVGRNPVCTDAVGTAVMGYNPQAGYRRFPFQGDNHLALLASVGVGTNDVGRIEVAGLSLDEALHPFNPDWRPVGVPIF